MAFALFKRPEPRMVQIEQSDMSVVKQIFDLIGRLEKELYSLSEALRSNDVAGVGARLAELENTFTRVKTKIDSLIVDVDTIMGIEAQNKDYIMFNDNDYIMDKKERLQLMSDTLEELLELLAQHPGLSELKGDLLQFLYSKLNLLINSLNSVGYDDQAMSSVYSRISSL
ncbi:hypothetical protein K9L97_00355 [Candidatus Woesearchaeota archaeon]|nr:hypothetical protein [Candidatus Woesearchaeota archaeon]